MLKHVGELKGCGEKLGPQIGRLELLEY